MKEGVKTANKAVTIPPKLLLKNLPNKKAGIGIRATIISGERIADFMKSDEVKTFKTLWKNIMVYGQPWKDPTGLPGKEKL